LFSKTSWQDADFFTSLTRRSGLSNPAFQSRSLPTPTFHRLSLSLRQNPCRLPFPTALRPKVGQAPPVLLGPVRPARAGCPWHVPAWHTSPVRLSAVSVPRMSGSAGQIPLANHAACHGHLGHAPARAGCPWHVPERRTSPLRLSAVSMPRMSGRASQIPLADRAACHGHPGHAPARAGCP
jgi:hypothetical protein